MSNFNYEKTKELIDEYVKKSGLRRKFNKSILEDFYQEIYLFALENNKEITFKDINMIHQRFKRRLNKERKLFISLESILERENRDDY